MPLLSHSYSPVSRRGFSLLELLIYISVIGIIMLFISGIFLSLGQGRGRIEARATVDSNVRFVMEKIAQVLKGASTVTTPSGAGTATSSLVTTVGSDTITYDLSGGQVRRRVGSGAREPINSSEANVTALTFTRLENTNTVLTTTVVTIEVKMDASYSGGGSDRQYSTSKKKTISLR